jgi:hypothetical protein
LRYLSLFDVYENQLEMVRAYAHLPELGHSSERLVLAGFSDTRYARVGPKSTVWD